MQSAQNWRCDDPPASLDSASSRCVPGAMPPQDRLRLHHLGQVKQIRPGPRDPHQQRPVTPDILCELQPVRFPEDERFIPQAFMPVDDRKLAIWFQCPCDSLREPSAVRHAMKRICHKNKIRGSSQFGNVVSVTRDNRMAGMFSGLGCWTSGPKIIQTARYLGCVHPRPSAAGSSVQHMYIL